VDHTGVGRRWATRYIGRIEHELGAQMIFHPPTRYPPTACVEDDREEEKRGLG